MFAIEPESHLCTSTLSRLTMGICILFDVGAPLSTHSSVEINPRSFFFKNTSCAFILHNTCPIQMIPPLSYNLLSSLLISTPPSNLRTLPYLLMPHHSIVRAIPSPSSLLLQSPPVTITPRPRPSPSDPTKPYPIQQSPIPSNKAIAI